MEVIKPKEHPIVTVYKLPYTEIEQIDFALCAQPKETLDSYYKRQETKPDLLINGGFFALSTGETVFTFVDNGKEISVDTRYLEGFGIQDNRLVLSTYNKNFSDFICGYPVFMKDGKVVSSSIGSEINYNARRTILGCDNFNVYVVIIDSPGYAFSRIKALLTELQIPNAINLDGGGSSRVLRNGVCEISNGSSNRAVDNVIAFYLKKERIIYRVQTGAFSKRTNADNYLAKIKALPDTISAGYKNAYIRIIDGLYKVQVGAFSKRENAEKVVKDLKRLGYDSFITIK